MKVLVAIDSYKGSLSSLEAGNAAKNGILRVIPDAEVMVKPLADGGEGTVEALIEGLQGEKINITVMGPMGESTECYYGILQDRTAVMEMAQAAGITKVAKNMRNPLVATTYGVGEMIADAINRGCRRFVVGIGGSATNDGGIGMLSALGYVFLDKEGKPVKHGAQELTKIVDVQADQVIPELKECEFLVACDVDNPLCGKKGATYVYGPQKGLATELCQSIDEDMKHYAQLVETFLTNINMSDNVGNKNNKRDLTLLESDRVKKTSYIDYPGAGAAGGLGFAFLTFLHGQLVSGVDLILDTIAIEKEMEQAQYVITGEGQLDYQTAMGKAPIGVAKRAKQYGCKVLAVAGSIGEGAQACNEAGIDAYFPIVQTVTTLEEALKKENAACNLERTVEQVFRMVAKMELCRN